MTTVLTELELDALTEMVNIGVNRAAASLREMVGEQVLLSVPKVTLVSRDRAIAILGENEISNLVGVHQVFEGEITGRALKDFANRDDVVIATKLNGRMRPGPNGAGLSRKAVLTELDHSLRRLGTDYVDLYQIHRWDPNTPIEETLEALNDVVKAGKARYIGASSMYAWQFAKALHTSERHGWTRFVSMQNHYNLIYREEEREMLPLCADQGIGVIPWSPLARGRLTRDWDASTARSEIDEPGRRLYVESDRDIVTRVAEIASARGAASAQVALAWLLGKPPVTAPIIGVTKPEHISDAVAALDIALDADEVAQLEKPYTPHQIARVT